MGAVEAVVDQIRHQARSDCQVTGRAAEVAFAWEKPFALPCNNHRERAYACENLLQLAFARYWTMKRDEYRCWKIGRQRLEQLGKRLDPARIRGKQGAMGRTVAGRDLARPGGMFELGFTPLRGAVVGLAMLVTLGGCASEQAGRSDAYAPNPYRNRPAYSCAADKDPDNPTCDGSIAAGWKLLVDSADNAFPSVNPRPVTPDETLRYFKAKAAGPATHVKFVVDTNQCSGQTSFQGEQDNDPTYSTDCRVTSTIPQSNGTTLTLVERDTSVAAAEVELLSDSPTVTGADTRFDVGTN